MLTHFGVSLKDCVGCKIGTVPPWRAPVRENDGLLYIQV